VDVEDELHNILDNQAPGKIHTVEALSDGYKVKVERLQVEDLHGQDVLDHLRNAIGTPYVLGGASLGGMDCSGSTLWSHAFEGVELPHKASQQHDLFRDKKPGFHLIQREQIKPGDLIFLHNDDHVATYLDNELGGRVIDAEPHNTQAPSGWPATYLGTGLRIRPMTGNYYCAWQFSNGIGRIEAINGKP
jgi:cell wall-associated NlpC family hydrolase